MNRHFRDVTILVSSERDLVYALPPFYRCAWWSHSLFTCMNKIENIREMQIWGHAHCVRVGDVSRRVG